MTDWQVQSRYDIAQLIALVHSDIKDNSSNQFKQAILFKVGEHLGLAASYMRAVDTQADI
ncbi:MAG: hypothetical protein ABSB40_12840 [Nitrososphaeria archaeon]|jgi:hypothetical protein